MVKSAFTLFRPITRDPRHYQIATLASLLAYGIFALDFDIGAARAAAILSTALLTQYICTRVWHLPSFDPRSALISGLSLCLLLRTNDVALALVAAIVAVASKFLIKLNGKHLFNPTNIAIVALMAVTGAVWVSPGQWGNIAFFAFLMACLGGLVVNRASRSDVTYAFIGFYMTLVFGRSIWLGEPLTIPIHRLENGALLLFTFFMISDPRTTPNSRMGRILFAFLVAFGAWYVQFRLFRTNGLLWALACCSLTVPLIDWLLPASRYQWGDFHLKVEATKTDLEVFQSHPAKEVVYETSRIDSRSPDSSSRVERLSAPGLLRFLRRQGRYQVVQQSIAGCPRAPRRSHRADDGERLQR
jgi:Na+-translocating ferredoxin:NAD+ oxidoreductase RnfD subunit